MAQRLVVGSLELGLADEVQERVADFRALQTFVVAHAFTVVASRPEVAVSDVEALFACARHLEQQPGLFAALLATDFADGAARVCDAIAAAPVEPATRRAILQRALTALEARERTRSDPPKLAARAIADADKLNDRLTALTSAIADAPMRLDAVRLIWRGPKT